MGFNKRKLNDKQREFIRLFEKQYGYDPYKSAYVYINKYYHQLNDSYELCRKYLHSRGLFLKPDEFKLMLSIFKFITSEKWIKLNVNY